MQNNKNGIFDVKNMSEHRSEYLTKLKMAVTDINRAVEEVKEAIDISTNFLDEFRELGQLEIIQGILEFASKEINAFSYNILSCATC